MATSRRGLFGRRVRLLAALLLAARAACFGPAAHRVAPRAPSLCAGLRLLAEPVEGSGRLGRRTTRIDFTCKACGSRTTRMINPEAYLTGVVIVQCGSATCGKHHGEADAPNYAPALRPAPPAHAPRSAPAPAARRSQ